jgi:hypothetical protein
MEERRRAGARQRSISNQFAIGKWEKCASAGSGIRNICRAWGAEVCVAEKDLAKVSARADEIDDWTGNRSLKQDRLRSIADLPADQSRRWVPKSPCRTLALAGHQIGMLFAIARNPQAGSGSPKNSDRSCLAAQILPTRASRPAHGIGAGKPSYRRLAPICGYAGCLAASYPCARIVVECPSFAIS